MHPNSAFRPDRTALLDHAAAIGFAHLFVATPAGPTVAHAPVTLHGDRLRFHLARYNRLRPHLDGGIVLASIAGLRTRGERALADAMARCPPASPGGGRPPYASHG